MKKIFILFFALFAVANMKAQVVIYEGHIENCLAGESMVAPVWVYISSADGKMYKANATTTSNPAVGLVFASVTSGNTGQIAFSGYFEWPSATFTPGQAQYLSAATSGAMTTTAPTNVQKLGYSVTSGRFKIDPQPFVASGGGGGGSDYLGTGFTSGGGSGSIPDGTVATLDGDFSMVGTSASTGHSVILSAGAATGTGESGGNISLTSGASSTGSGGNVNMVASDGADGGGFSMMAGNALSSTGGAIVMAAGLGEAGDGGIVSIEAGYSNSAEGGSVTISAGGSDAAGGGNIVLVPGNGDTSDGEVKIKKPGTSNYAIFSTASIATSNKTFKFPNQTATFNTITSSTGAPASTPVALGQTYIDTDADAAYISTGTGSSADYKMITRPYKVYVANITQSTTGAPSATVLENTLGVTPTWARSSTGVYTLTATGVWTTGKTTLPDSRVFLGGDDQDEVLATRWVRTSADVLTMLVLKTNLALESNVEMNTSEEGFTIEIRVYP